MNRELLDYFTKRLAEEIKEEIDSDSSIDDATLKELLKDYVKNTDYATSDKAGVVKVDPTLGQSGFYVTNDRQLKIFEADPVDIDSNQPMAVITASNVGYAVEKHGTEMGNKLYSNAIKKTITAQDMVFIRDISPLQHTVKVRVSSDTVTDLTKINIDVLDKGAGNAGTYTPSSDGTVDILSISPEMGIVPQSPSVTITVEYNQDINAFIEESDSKFGDISSALDELHAYAQALINGGAE